MGGDGADRRIAAVFADPETDISWTTPVHEHDALKTLVELPTMYDTVDDSYRIADYGCGEGTLVVGTQEQDGLAETYPQADITGFDFCTEYAEAAAVDAGYYRVEWVEGDMYDTVPEQPAADWGYAINVLQASDDPEATLDLLYNHITEEGYLTVAVGSEYFVELIPDTLLETDADTSLPTFTAEAPIDGESLQVEQYLFPSQPTERLLKHAGFDIVDTTPLPLNPDDVEGLQQAVAPDTVPTEPPAVDMYLLQKPGDTDGT